MSTLRVGIIGCGVIAPTHIEAYQQHGEVEVTWACDLERAKAATLSEKYAIPRITESYAEVLAADDVDLISICTDHASHAPIAVGALDAGKHVLCEKALSHDRAGLREMLAAGDRHPDQVFSGVFQHRFDRINQRLREMIADGTLGTMLTAGVQLRCLRTNTYYRCDQWRGTWAEEGGSVLINQAIHYIDLLRWLMGGVELLSGAYANITHEDVMETEDTAVAALTFSNGALGTLEATCSSHINWEPTLTFHGTEGSIELRHDKPFKVLFRKAAQTERIRAELEACYNAPAMTTGKSYYGTGHPAQIADVLAAVREGRPPFVTARSAAHTVDLVLSLYESQRSKQPVTLQLNDLNH